MFNNPKIYDYDENNLSTPFFSDASTFKSPNLNYLLKNKGNKTTLTQRIPHKS